MELYSIQQKRNGIYGHNAMIEVSLEVGIRITPKGLKLCPDNEAMAPIELNLVLGHEDGEFFIAEIQATEDGKNFEAVRGEFYIELMQFILREHWGYVEEKAYEKDDCAFSAHLQAERRDAYAPITV
jgi:hypothetical protein